MIPFKSFRYIYPPRPENAVASETLLDYDNGEYLAQPKLNGDCVEIYTNGIDVKIYNRHKKIFKKSDQYKDCFIKLHRETLGAGKGKNKWIVLVGEFMDKGKLNDWGENFNNNFVIHDIIVYDSMQLVGKTYLERVEMLDRMYGKEDLEIIKNNKVFPTGVRKLKFLYTTSVEGVYRVKSFRDCLGALWNDLVLIDMYEGLVLKRCDAQLENGISEQNNMAGQVKVRKATKNYKF